MKKRVADIIFDTLVDLGIEDCFAVVGGGAMHLDNALAVHPKMKTLFNHHEQACAMAAEAYARYSGNMAAVCVTSGPGATNTITGVMGAWVDSVPMIVISGNVRYETSVEYSGLDLRYRGLQEFDIIHSIQNMTKYSCYLTNAKMVKYEVEKAVYFAMSGRRGPVWIDVPQDVQNEMIETDELESYVPDEITQDDDLKMIDSINEMFYKSQRPCILMGTGIQCTHSESLFEKLLEKLKVPVVGGAWVGDIFYSDHPLYYGLSGNAGGRTGNFILQNSDFILVLANSLSYKQTGYDIESFAPHARICMVDIDENEWKKNQDKIETFVNKDIVAFMKAYCSHSTEEINAPKEWLEYCNKVKNKFSPFEGMLTSKEHGRVNKYVFWKKMLDKAPKDSLFALGNSSIGMAANQIGRKYKDQRMISNYICGSMGFDLPAAIGLAVASRKNVYCVTGDGSIMMNLQELQTIIHNHLPIKIVVMENEGYGAIRQTCKNFFHGMDFGCSPQTGVSCPDFLKVARAFGFEADVCDNIDQLDEKLDQFLNCTKPFVLLVRQQLDDPVLPKLMSKLDHNGKMTSPKLHDMYPFVSEEDMKWLLPYE